MRVSSIDVEPFWQSRTAHSTNLADGWFGVVHTLYVDKHIIDYWLQRCQFEVQYRCVQLGRVRPPKHRSATSTLDIVFCTLLPATQHGNSFQRWVFSSGGATGGYPSCSPLNITHTVILLYELSVFIVILRRNVFMFYVLFTITSLRYVRVFAIAIPCVVCRLSVCRLSVTLVHPTQAVEPFDKISSPLCTLASVQNFTEIVLGEPLRRER